MVTARAMEALRTAAIPYSFASPTVTANFNMAEDSFPSNCDIDTLSAFYESTRRHRDHRASRDCQNRFPAHAF